MILKHYQKIAEIEKEACRELKSYLQEQLNTIGASYDNGMGSLSFKSSNNEIYLSDLLKQLSEIDGSFENWVDVNAHNQNSLIKIENTVATCSEKEDHLSFAALKQEQLFSNQIAEILFPIIQDYLKINKKNLSNMSWGINKKQLLKFNEFLSNMI